MNITKQELQALEDIKRDVQLVCVFYVACLNRAVGIPLPQSEQGINCAMLPNDVN